MTTDAAISLPIIGAALVACVPFAFCFAAAGYVPPRRDYRRFKIHRRIRKNCRIMYVTRQIS